jgi:hypothetical protein
VVGVEPRIWDGERGGKKGGLLVSTAATRVGL